MKLTVTVITRNEAAHIGEALDSVAWADERLVVDAFSDDETVAIARARGARVEQRAWPGYSDQKNHAADLASHDWILSLDADERVTPDLAAEIRDLLARGPSTRGYRVPRVTWYLGRWIRGTDWYPDYQLRLYDRRAGRWNGRAVHESVTLAEPPGRLRHALQHYAYRDIPHHLATIDRYTTLAAEQAHTEGRRSGPWAAVLHAKAAFLRNYVLRRGFTQGAAGLVVSVLNSYYVFLKFVKLWDLERRAHPRGVARLPEASERSERAWRPERGTGPPRGRQEGGPGGKAPRKEKSCFPSTSTPPAPGAAARTRCSSP